MTVKHENNEIAEIGYVIIGVILFSVHAKLLLLSYSDIDVAFFVVTVDLWSADGKHEMNLVLHPSSADRYIPTNVAKPRRRATAPTTPQRGADPQSSQVCVACVTLILRPVIIYVTTLYFLFFFGFQSSFTALPNPATSYAHAQHSSQYPFAPPPSVPGSAGTETPPQFPAQPYPGQPGSMGWAYPPTHVNHPSHPPAHPPPLPHQSSLPSIHTFHQRPQSPPAPGPSSATVSAPPPSSGWHSHPQDSSSSDGHAPNSTSPYRPWAPPTAGQHSPPPPYVDQGNASMQGTAAPPPTAPQTTGDPYAHTRYPPPPESSSYPPPPPPDGAPVYAQAPYPQAPPPPPPPPPHAYSHYGHPQQQHYPHAPHPAHAPPTPSHQQSQPAYSSPPSPSPPAAPSHPPPPRHTYTRTLVGPLSANACRLNDEHRKPGIFFLFQDLSIRTEGTFRLRMRLMNVGA